MERFIDKGFRDGDFLTLAQLLNREWLDKEGEASNAGTAEFKQNVLKWRQERTAWEAKHGAVQQNVRRWIEFLKKCEAQIDTIPAAFAGLR